MALIDEKVSQFTADADLVHGIVHGPASGPGSTVTTDGGSVRTFAKIDADNAGLQENLGAASIAPGDETLADFLSTKISCVVNSIAALKALNKAKYTRAFVTGYYAVGDGGGGHYYYDAADTTSADNGGTVIVASDAGRWKLSWQMHLSVKQFGAKGDGVNNDAPAINAALLSYAAAPGRSAGGVYAPSGKYRLEGTVIVPEHVRFFGALSDGFSPGLPGTELAWYGPSGSTALITSTGDEYDWSRASIEDMRIKNYTATVTGYGARVRNAQNGSYLKNVFVIGFPERQCLVYEPAGRAGAPGTCPGYFFMDNCFFIGGLIPLEVQVGVEQILVTNFGVDTDSASTCGVLVTRTANGQAQRAPVKFLGGKVEIQQASADIDGIIWNQDLAISFDTVAVQRNDNIASTKAAFRYTGTSRSIPRAEVHNCSTWNLRDKLRLDQAGISLAAEAVAAPESFSFSRTGALRGLAFARETLTAGMSSVAMPACGNVNAGSQGYIVTRPCIIAGIAARHTAAITADSITLSIIKNGSTFVRSLALNSSNQGRFEDYLGGSTIINGPAFQLAAGDRVSMQINTGSGIAPAGGHVLAEVMLKDVG